MQILRKLIYALIGYAISEVLFKFVFVNIIVASASNIETLAAAMPSLVFYVFRPICIIIGSIMVGYFLSKMDNNVFASMIFYNPGIFVSLVMLIEVMKPIFYHGMPKQNYILEDVLGWLICSLIYIAVSAFGIHIGYKRKLQTESDQVKCL